MHEMGIAMEIVDIAKASIPKDTPLEGAELSIEELAVVAQCKDCQTQWTVTKPVFTCKACQSGSIDILSGRELDITSIEIEDNEE